MVVENLAGLCLCNKGPCLRPIPLSHGDMTFLPLMEQMSCVVDVEQLIKKCLCCVIKFGIVGLNVQSVFCYSPSILLDIVPASHQDLATRSHSSDALTLYHHQSHSQATVQSMSVGERSAVFMGSTSGTTINHVVNVSVSTGMSYNYLLVQSRTLKQLVCLN